MSNRFHNKWHRHNHHTDKPIGEPDAGWDPIASPEDPFKGPFVIDSLSLALSANGPLISNELRARTDDGLDIAKSDGTSLIRVGKDGTFKTGVAEGVGTTASGNASHAEGANTTASGGVSHAEGLDTTASGGGSHAEGRGTTASGNYSHAEGNRATASGYASHAEGSDTTASGNGSHAGGFDSLASQTLSYARGRRARSVHTGASVESDNQHPDFESTAENQKSFRFAGGYRFMGGEAEFEGTIESLPSGVDQFDASSSSLIDTSTYTVGALNGQDTWVAGPAYDVYDSGGNIIRLSASANLNNMSAIRALPASSDTSYHFRLFFPGGAYTNTVALRLRNTTTDVLRFNFTGNGSGDVTPFMEVAGFSTAEPWDQSITTGVWYDMVVTVLQTDNTMRVYIKPESTANYTEVTIAGFPQSGWQLSSTLDVNRLEMITWANVSGFQELLYLGPLREFDQIVPLPLINRWIDFNNANGGRLLVSGYDSGTETACLRGFFEGVEQFKIEWGANGPKFDLAGTDIGEEIAILEDLGSMALEDAGDFVNITGEQTISGTKTFNQINTGQITVNGNVNPLFTNQRNFGTSTLRWLNVFCNGVNASGLSLLPNIFANIFSCSNFFTFQVGGGNTEQLRIDSNGLTLTQQNANSFPVLNSQKRIEGKTAEEFKDLIGAASTDPATDTTAGLIKKATTAQTISGDVDDAAVTPAGLNAMIKDGLVLKAPNESLWKLTVNNDGNLITEEVV